MTELKLNKSQYGLMHAPQVCYFMLDKFQLKLDFPILVQFLNFI